MKLYVLFAQRKESYERQWCAPEALTCMDDVGNDENPEYLARLAQRARDDDMIVDAKIFEIELPKGTLNYIRDQLMGKMPPIHAVNVSIVE